MTSPVHAKTRDHEEDAYPHPEQKAWRDLLRVQDQEKEQNCDQERSGIRLPRAWPLAHASWKEARPARRPSFRRGQRACLKVPPGASEPEVHSGRHNLNPKGTSGVRPLYQVKTSLVPPPCSTPLQGISMDKSNSNTLCASTTVRLLCPPLSCCVNYMTA